MFFCKLVWGFLWSWFWYFYFWVLVLRFFVILDSKFIVVLWVVLVICVLESICVIFLVCLFIVSVYIVKCGDFLLDVFFVIKSWVDVWEVICGEWVMIRICWCFEMVVNCFLIVFVIVFLMFWFILLKIKLLIFVFVVWMIFIVNMNFVNLLFDVIWVNGFGEVFGLVEILNLMWFNFFFDYFFLFVEL